MIKITAKRHIRPDARYNIMECHSAIHRQTDDLSPKHLRYRGIGLVWTVLVIFTLFLFAGLTIDVAKLCLVNHQMHNAADAAALAGAPWVKKDAAYARTLAVKFGSLNAADHNDVYLDRNDENLPYGDIIIGRYTYKPADGKSYFFCYDPLAENPIPVNAMAVNVSRTIARSDAGGPISLLFGPLVNVASADLSGSCVIIDPDTYEIVPYSNSGATPKKHGPYAIAVAVGGQGSGLVCLRHDLTGLKVQGTASLTVINDTDPYRYEEGAIWINSNDDENCLYTTGTSVKINADIINITADDLTIKGSFEFPPEPDMYLNFRQPPIPDPLAWLNNDPANKPTTTTNSDLNVMGINNGGITKNQTPPDPIPYGYYPDGIVIDSGTVENPVHLSAGIYVLDGAGLQVGSKAVVECEDGVFFYITGDGICDIQAGATFSAKPMTSGLYEGIIIAQDDLDLNAATINGGPGLLVEGTLYFPQHIVEQDRSQQKDYALSLSGNSEGFNNQIIADSVYIFGDGEVKVNYKGQNPAPVSRAYLVE